MVILCGYPMGYHLGGPGCGPLNLLLQNTWGAAKQTPGSWPISSLPVDSPLVVPSRLSRSCRSL